MSVLFEQYQALRRGKTQEAQPGHPSIPFEVLEGLYQEVLDRLDTKGVEGPSWLDSIDFNDPFYDQARNKLNEVWLKCLEGGTTLEEFKRVLADYKEVVLSVRPKVETQERLF